MPITESHFPPGLIRSAYLYEKNGRLYQVGFDLKSAALRVFSGRPATVHEMASHFERTTSNGSEEIAEIIHSALSRTGAAPVGKGTRTFAFMPTSRCNMGCAYCGQTHAPGSVSSAVSSRFLERVQAGFRSPNVRHVHVAWFGGEPLLSYRTIIDLSNQITEMAAQVEKPYSSKMTTNGALLTPSRMQHLAEDALVSRFDITLDGPSDVHDRHRPLKAGGTSFDKIVATLSWYRDAELRQPAIAVLRTNVDRHNLPFVGQYLETMSRLGFNDAKKFLFEISPIHSWGNDVSSIALPTQDAARHEVAWMELMEHLGLPYGVLPGRPRASTCVATDPHCEVIDNQGNLFSCTEIPLTEVISRGLVQLGEMTFVSPGTPDLWARTALRWFISRSSRHISIAQVAARQAHARLIRSTARDLDSSVGSPSPNGSAAGVIGSENVNRVMGLLQRASGADMVTSHVG
jgi:sulfatase maturation enzyme AslB (radical SAM superfamily)